MPKKKVGCECDQHDFGWYQGLVVAEIAITVFYVLVKEFHVVPFHPSCFPIVVLNPHGYSPPAGTGRSAVVQTFGCFFN